MASDSSRVHLAALRRKGAALSRAARYAVLGFAASVFNPGGCYRIRPKADGSSSCYGVICYNRMMQVSLGRPGKSRDPL